MAMLLLALLISAVMVATLAGPEMDFEVGNQETMFTAESSLRSISTKHHKGGSKSLLWEWDAKQPGSTNPKLKLTLSSLLTIKGKELRKGAFKFWIYRENKLPSTTMQIFFGGITGTTPNETPPTNVNLDFRGWRAVWIGYEEFGKDGTGLDEINTVKFVISPLVVKPGQLYIDLVRFVTTIIKQTRDMVVKHVGAFIDPTTRNYNINPAFHNDEDFWQQSLRWHETPVVRSNSPITDMEGKIKELDVIEDRLENWYAKVNENLGSPLYNRDKLKMPIPSPWNSTAQEFETFKKKRWNSLLENIDDAHNYYNLINFNENRPSLFPKVSEFGEDKIPEEFNGKAKFGFIFLKILLPLSLEYNFMSRENEVRNLAEKECRHLKSSNNLTVQRGIARIVGANTVMMEEFGKMVHPVRTGKSLNCRKSPMKASERLKCRKGPVRTNKGLKCSKDGIKLVENLIRKFNEKVRFGRIRQLLSYLSFQGWAEGSGLGSLDHEMNKAGVGFMHSMFLLRHALRKPFNKQMLDELMKTMKWYNDFNEIYQPDEDYVYDGTTADRMRTLLLYRLMIILIPPLGAHKKRKIRKEQKIRDMNHYRTWIKHSLGINKGLGGVIKPDYTTFHHKTFYGSAYAPHALHNAAFVQYLLSGTSFALEQESKDNLRKALAVLRTVAVKYSTPEGICGRFPNFNKAILAESIPAYAYISYTASGANLGEESDKEDAAFFRFFNSSSFVFGKDKSKEELDRPEMFLRLLDTKNPSVTAYLEKGYIKNINYLNTIGSLDILKKAATMTCKSNPPCNAESSPVGHWTKSFAALSIHRRKNWSVAAKGFNHYFWDYESGTNENVYGVFQSHGSLQISNSEESLKSYDVGEGWDWTRIPGATTVNVEIDHIQTVKANNYNPGKFAGGVRFLGAALGTAVPQNGAFGMVFKNPKYRMKNKESLFNTMEFGFKKSYFFYNHLVVCVGSGIMLENVDKRNAQTTLFQDKLVDPAQSSTITINGKSHDLRVLLKDPKHWGTSQTVLLKDTNGNTYQVKNAKENGLHVEISDQNSKRSNGCEKSKGRYATAWLEHKRTKRSSTARRRKHTKKNQHGLDVPSNRDPDYEMGRDVYSAIHTGGGGENEEQEKDVDAEVDNAEEYDLQTNQHMKTDVSQVDDVDAKTNNKHFKKAYDVDKFKIGDMTDEIDTGNNNEMDEDDGGSSGINSKLVDAGTRSRDARSSSDTINSREKEEYEYAVLINGGLTAMLTKYKVFRKNGKIPEAAHVVEFNNLPDRADQLIKVFGYSIFVGQTDTGFGPVQSASAPCMIMVELAPKTLHLAISNPSITFKYDQKYKNKATCTRKKRNEIANIFHPKNSNDIGAKMLFCVEGEQSMITVVLKVPVKSIINVKVDGQAKNPSTYAKFVPPNMVTFSNLVNGFTTEVFLLLE